LNRLIAFEDKPKDYDAWNIDADFENVSWNLESAQKIEVICPENEIIVEITRKFNSSTIHQSVVFRGDDRRIDFRTRADWHEHQILLKAAFPVDVDSKKISCEIQYGSLQRNLTRETTWDKAKFECCAHKWIDITDDSGGFGVAILNDSKYGYDAKEKLMRLTLIKSGIFPNPNADQGKHEFVYSLLPHKGGISEGKVIERARLLNFESHSYVPEQISGSVCARELSKVEVCDEKYCATGRIDIEWLEKIEDSILELPETSGVFIDAIKMAEDGDAVIIRLYEGYGEARTVKGILFGGIDTVPVDVTCCDLLEKEISDEQISFDKGTKTISFELKPYEIKTIRAEI
jgi:alpha-mannosidase